MILLTVFTHFLLVFGYLPFATPIAAHLLHVIHHLVISRTFWLGSLLNRFLQPLREVLAFLLHILVDDHLLFSAFRMLISLLTDLHFCCGGDVLDGVLLICIAFLDLCEIVLDLFLSILVGFVQSVFKLLGEFIN